MTREELIDQMICAIKEIWVTYWRCLPDEQRLRLAGMEEEVQSVKHGLEKGLWVLLAEQLDNLAKELEGRCDCGRRRESRKDSVKLELLGHWIKFPCTYLYCRVCRKGTNPVRRWLGLESGGVSLAFERALTDLTTRMTFGDTVNSMKEHHAQSIDRTKAERVTYQAGQKAEEYLEHRRDQAQERLLSGEQNSVEQLTFTADGGAVPIGVLSRPKADEVRSNTPKTEIRKLAKGKRTITGRESRLISVHDKQPNSARVVDCHIAPYDNTQYSGERMFAAAVEAGLGDKSRIHGVFDMGKWIHKQFEEQFFAYEHTACADIIHVTEYLMDAAKVIVGQEKAKSWAMERKRLLLAGGYEKVFAELTNHKCQDNCIKNEKGKCLVRVAETYFINNSRYIKDYSYFISLDLPVGSGEAESGIRHIIKKRMSVAGAWEEGNACLLLALLAIRASGWWDDFWHWRDQQDCKAWHNRQKGKVRALFRGRRRRKQPNLTLAETH